MKRYRKFMDGVKAPESLAQRLRELKEPEKKPPAWKKYGAMAAALVLVLGLGGWGLARSAGQSEFLAFQDHRAESGSNADIALASPEEGSGEKTLGGYDVTTGSGSQAMVSHYVLPYIDYGTGVEGANEKIALDFALGEGYTEREVSREEIGLLLGGEEVLSTHLDWGGYELSGRRYDRADGTPGLIMLSGYQGPLDHFEFNLMYGELPPSCTVFGDGVTQEVLGLTVEASKYDGEQGCGRRVSFMKGDWGYCFDLTATDAQRAELLVSRLVRQIAAHGVEEESTQAAAAPAADPAAYTCPDCGQTFLDDDSWKAHVHSCTGVDGSAAMYTCPDCGGVFPAGSVHHHPYLPAEVPEQDTPGYDPREAADPSYNAPAASASPYICTGYPVPEAACEICGQTYAEGTPHFHEVCGYPLAPQPKGALSAESPPKLRLSCGGKSLECATGGYSWTWQENGESVSVVADGVHPLEYKDAPSLTTAADTAQLSMDDSGNPPARLAVVCWPESWRDSHHLTGEDGELTQSGVLTLREGGWIYEVTAYWLDQNQASYVFCIVKE